ncbi:redoxin domain-containing protein [Lichenihabitans psoromatis]|uniref:redoxin domain-containing protein n=1 Tax=Lichenihabitans psoromatis TaxID=2528642 RepID=UPI00103834E8|nr:redoxin domain-containing protein [Lichenihabitans psoromatis]
MPMLQNDQIFPNLEIPAAGGGVLNLPHDLAGSYGVLLIYRGHWCPFCNDQLAAFAGATEALTKEGIKVVAFSVEDEASTQEFITKHKITFKVGQSANIELIAAAIGAYQSHHPVRGPFLENTGFVLAPDGTVLNAVYSSRAIGRLVPNDVIRFVAFMKTIAK